MCVGVSVWLGWSCIRVAGFHFLCAQHVSDINISIIRSNNTTNVVIQQNNRNLLMMDILMSETCWAHKKWNKISSDIKLVFYYSTITMMQVPINIRWAMHFKKSLFVNPRLLLCSSIFLPAFSFQFVAQNVFSCRTWHLPDSSYYRSLYVLDLYHGGRFVTKHLILWTLLYDFK